MGDYPINPGGMQGDVPDLGTYQPPNISPAMDPEIHAAAVHHSRLADALNSVASVLSGGGQTLRMNKNPDGTVDVQPVDLTPGQRWGRVAALALGGAAKGFAAGQGPGGAGKAAGAGFDVGLQGSQLWQAQEDKTRALADEANKQAREKQLFNANMALMDQKLISAKNENQRSGVIFANQVRDSNLQFTKIMRDMGAVLKGTYANDDEMAAAFNGDNELQQGHHGQNGLTFPNNTYDKDGKVTGVEGWYLPEDKRSQLNENRIELPRTKINPKTGEIEQDTPYVIEPHTMKNEDILATTKLISDKNNDNTKNSIELKQKNKELELRKQQIGVESAANKEKFSPMEMTKPDGSRVWVGVGDRGTIKQYDLPQNAMLAKPGETAKLMHQIDAPYLLPARNAERAATLFDDAYKDFLNGAKTGAPGMAALSYHLGTTFGGLKGTRITKTLIEEHLGARNITDDAVTALQKFTTGEPLSANQWKDFRTLIQNSRTEAWRSASDAALGIGLDPNQFLPATMKHTDMARGYQGPAQGQPQQPPAGPQGNVSQAARAPGGQTPPIEKLAPDHDTTFANGTTWRIVNGQPRQVVNGQVQ